MGNLSPEHFGCRKWNGQGQQKLYRDIWNPAGGQGLGDKSGPLCEKPHKTGSFFEDKLLASSSEIIFVIGTRQDI